MSREKTVWVRGQHKTSMSNKLHQLLDPKDSAVERAQPHWAPGSPSHARKMTIEERRRATEKRVIKEIAQYVFKLERADKASKKGRYKK